jgi:hypothetical protein
MKQVGYLKRATKKFLHGTKFRAPVEAVEAGFRSLGEWADTLTQERELESSPAPRRRSSRAPQRDIAQA